MLTGSHDVFLTIRVNTEKWASDLSSEQGTLPSSGIPGP